jgi:ribokinase
MDAQHTGSRVVVVGSINADLTLLVDRHPLPGETLMARGGTRTPGGKGANQALAAARAGAEVALLGAVGQDDAAPVALSLLREAGVDLGTVATVPGPTGLATVTVAADGENTILVVAGANDTVTPERVRSRAELVSSAAVVLVQGEIPRESTEEALRLATGRTVLNPAPVLALDAELVRASDPLVVNEHEAAQVLAALTDTGSPDPEAAAADPVGTVTALRDAGVRSVVLTLGGAGSVVADDSGTVRVPAADVHAVDTTGAGDGFIGALAARLADGAGLAEAARYAARFSGASVTRTGAQPSYPMPGDTLSTLGDEE